jgi:glycosyltransferase involved in cell wall biosynthesis
MVNSRLPVKLPSLTVVTPCLNAAATIGETLESVRSQAYPGVEHVVMDGGSTDGTLDIVRSFDGVELVSEPDGGRVEAANKGAARAGGEVVAWLNADDRYEPGALLRVGRALAERPEAPWATGYCRIIDGDGKEIRKGVTAYKNWLLRHYSMSLHLTQNFVSDPATFVRRSALQRAGPLDPSFLTAHDYDLWLRVARLGRPVVIREYLSSFRMTEGTLSMEGFDSQFREHVRAARRHGAGYPVSVGANAFTSRAIVTVYRALRLSRRISAARR